MSKRWPSLHHRARARRLAARACVLLGALAAAGQTPGLALRGSQQVGDAPSEIARLSDLQPGWNTIVPGGETTCSDGSPYQFAVRAANPAKLLVYFQGGGACFDGRTCDPDRDPSYTVNLSSLDPGQFNGIFAFDHPENPFGDSSAVVVPYCTGDVHLGDRDEVYQAPAARGHSSHPVTVRHRGATNARAVLDWTYAHFLRPESIFVTGSSGGAIPSPFYTHEIAQRYPDARIAQLGDGAGGYRGAAASGLHDQWRLLEVLSGLEEFAQMPPKEFSFEKLYAAVARRHPRITFAEYDTAEDSVQLRFLRLAGVNSTRLLPLLRANYADIKESVENFRTFLAGGDLHTILARPQFYTYAANGVRIRDWVAALAAGEPVSDVQCTGCARPEIAGAPPGPPR